MNLTFKELSYFTNDINITYYLYHNTMNDFLNHDDNDNRLSGRCDKRKCGLFLVTCGLSVGICFFVVYLVNQWGKLEHIS